MSIDLPKLIRFVTEVAELADWYGLELRDFGEGVTVAPTATPDNYVADWSMIQVRERKHENACSN